MATRRRIGVSAATTEAARRQLMQPVPSWEKVWAPATGVGSGLKVYKWIKTEKVQQFSDDEGGVDEPLAPLPDEPELVEGDEDLEQDEARADNAPTKEAEATPADMDATQDEPPSKVPSPKPQLMVQSSTEDESRDQSEGLDASLKPIEGNMDVGDEQKGVDGLELDISGLGPDGLQLENAHDLSQLEGPDGLMGGPLMDDSVDPFSEAS
ncbi:hypothetical protein CVT26_002050 [Gymnopilus dilepis]|uniref:Uncharacterized protein n=1 Tax=Gymnopilus dilepis TaxID=231916 RepID=A0A409VBV7_9AGAR|nr:hypothetical protein CVT26_002050 [Gymnopilus dilepis]